nr:hypothetical protein CFP56_20969 [Quercus suber]
MVPVDMAIRPADSHGSHAYENLALHRRLRLGGCEHAVLTASAHDPTRSNLNNAAIQSMRRPLGHVATLKSYSSMQGRTKGKAEERFRDRRKHRKSTS